MRVSNEDMARLVLLAIALMIGIVVGNCIEYLAEGAGP